MTVKERMKKDGPWDSVGEFHEGLARASKDGNECYVALRRE